MSRPARSSALAWARTENAVSVPSRGTADARLGPSGGGEIVPAAGWVSDTDPAYCFALTSGQERRGACGTEPASAGLVSDAVSDPQQHGGQLGARDPRVVQRALRSARQQPPACDGARRADRHVRAGQIGGQAFELVAVSPDPIGQAPRFGHRRLAHDVAQPAGQPRPFGGGRESMPVAADLRDHVRGRIERHARHCLAVGDEVGAGDDQPKDRARGQRQFQRGREHRRDCGQGGARHGQYQ